MVASLSFFIYGSDLVRSVIGSFRGHDQKAPGALHAYCALLSLIPQFAFVDFLAAARLFFWYISLPESLPETIPRDL